MRGADGRRDTHRPDTLPRSPTPCALHTLAPASNAACLTLLRPADTRMGTPLITSVTPHPTYAEVNFKLDILLPVAVVRARVAVINEKTGNNEAASTDPMPKNTAAEVYLKLLSADQKTYTAYVRVGGTVAHPIPHSGQWQFALSMVRAGGGQGRATAVLANDAQRLQLTVCCTRCPFRSCLTTAR